MLPFSVDVGGSLVRVVYGKGIPTIFSSELAMLPTGTRYLEEIKDPLSICEVTMQDGEVYRIAKGAALNYYVERRITCDNNTLKSLYIGTYLNALYAIARLAINMDEEITHPLIAIALPPREAYSRSKDELVAKLVGTHKVAFPLSGDELTFTFEEENITVLPEGLSAIFTTMPEELETVLLANSILLLDCGYRSLEVAVLKDGDIHRGAYDTHPIGGINMESLLASRLNEYGHFLDSEEIREVLKEGSFRKGTQLLEVGEIIEQIKGTFALSVKQAVVQTLNSASLNLTSLNYLLVIGRAFNQTGTIGTPNYGGSLATMVGDLLNLEVVELPDAANANILGMVNLMMD